jgi:group I intron endonuclease
MIYENKEKLKDAFTKFSTLGVEKVMEYDKNEELINLIENKTLNDKIYYFEKEDEWKININKINPKLIFCETQMDMLIWTYYRKRVSKLRYSKGPGRNIRILVQDTITQKYIGIIGLSSDILHLKERDNYIGWSRDIKKTKLNNIMNISCCVPLQPFGFNYNGGKLLASLCFSKEVYDYYYSKYKEPLVALITTSINGKSIQYERLPFLKFIGYTSGTGCLHFPNDLYKLGMEYCKYNNINVENISLSSGKLKRLEIILKNLDLPKNLLFHYSKRGIYFGYLNEFAKDFLLNKVENFIPKNLQNVKQIALWWKERWALNRINTVNISLDKKLYTFDNNLHEEYISLLPKLEFSNELSQKEKKKLYMQEYRNKPRNISFKLQDGSELKFGYSDIYKIVCIPTNKIYIGKAVHVLNKKNPQKHGALGRWKRHQSSNSNCSILYKAINKYGIDNFTIEVICVCKTEYENEMERKMIREYNTITPNGYNILQGGEGNYVKSGDDHHYSGKKFSDEYKKKLSDVHSGEKHHFYGKFFTDTHKKNLGHGISIAKREYDDKIFMEILNEKGSFDTIDEITEKIRNKHNIKIDRNIIAKIWNGKIKPIDSSICDRKDYKDLISFVRKKIHKRILTDNEIDFINSFKDKIDEKSGKKFTTIRIAEIVLEKFGKKISTGFISDIWKGKLLPVYLIRSNFVQTGKLGDIPDEIGDIPDEIGDIPDKIGDIPDEIGDIPDEIYGNFDKTSSNPEGNRFNSVKNITSKIQKYVDVVDFSNEKKICKKDGCKLKEKEGGYCGKHTRQIIIDEAKNNGLELCDPARGCFKPLENGRRKCEECRGKQYQQERKRIENRRKQKEKIELENEEKSLCLMCGNIFESFLTKHNKKSTKCERCYLKQKNYENERSQNR